jgi:hypothetical protein
MELKAGRSELRKQQHVTMQREIAGKRVVVKNLRDNADMMRGNLEVLCPAPMGQVALVCLGPEGGEFAGGLRRPTATGLRHHCACTAGRQIAGKATKAGSAGSWKNHRTKMSGCANEG